MDDEEASQHDCRGDEAGMREILGRGRHLLGRRLVCTHVHPHTHTNKHEFGGEEHHTIGFARDYLIRYCPLPGMGRGQSLFDKLELFRCSWGTVICIRILSSSFAYCMSALSAFDGP